MLHLFIVSIRFFYWLPLWATLMCYKAIGGHQHTPSSLFIIFLIWQSNEVWGWDKQKTGTTIKDFIKELSSILNTNIKHEFLWGGGARSEHLCFNNNVYLCVKIRFLDFKDFSVLKWFFSEYLYSTFTSHSRTACRNQYLLHICTKTTWLSFAELNWTLSINNLAFRCNVMSLINCW